MRPSKEASKNLIIDSLELLDHPNIIKVLNKDVYPEHLNLQQEWIFGESMLKVMKPKPYPENDVHRLVLPIFDAVIYCHNFGVSH